MANVIKHKRGSGSDPSASNLVIGELAIRTDNGKLFTKMDSGAIAEIAGGGSDIAINTLSSSSATGGGSATFNGSAYRFTLSSPPSVSAQQLLVSVNGVVQKPVAGTGQPSEGFSVDGTDIIFGDAPATGSDFFILTFRSLGVSEPADNSVTSAKIADGAIVNADINASAAIAGTKISPDFGSQIISTTGVTNLSGELRANGNVKITNQNPKITFTDSNNNDDFELKNNNGVFTIRDATDGADRFTINSAGRVAINGLTSPPGIFNINTGSGTSIANTLVLRRSGSSDYHGVTLSTGTTQDWSFGQNSLNAFEVYENGAAATTRLTILNGGATGIGTRSPSEKLHVAGNIKATGSLTSGSASTIGGDLTVNGFVLSQGTSNRGAILGALSVGYSNTYLTVQPISGQTQLHFNFNNGDEVHIGHSSGSTLTVNGAIKPKTDSASDLGLTGTRFRAAYVDTYYGDGSNLTGITSTTINNNADNRIITGSGTANTLNGESELTYDGNSVVLENSAANIAAIRNGGGATLTLHGNPDSGNTAATNNHDMGNIAFKTADGTDRNNVCAYITGRAVGTFTNSSHPTQLEFWTTTDSSTTTTKRVIITKSGMVIPAANNTYDLGDTSNRWRNVYTNDLNLSNEGGSNDVDGTWGSYTIQEGAEDLFLVNKRNGKKYKFNLTEVS